MANVVRGQGTGGQLELWKPRKPRRGKHKGGRPPKGPRSSERHERPASAMGEPTGPRRAALRTQGRPLAQAPHLRGDPVGDGRDGEAHGVPDHPHEHPGQPPPPDRRSEGPDEARARDAGVPDLGGAADQPRALRTSSRRRALSWPGVHGSLPRDDPRVARAGSARARVRAQQLASPRRGSAPARGGLDHGSDYSSCVYLDRLEGSAKASSSSRPCERPIGRSWCGSRGPGC